MALWDGRFESGPAAAMVAFSQSLDVDMQMWREDIAGSQAHVAMLGEVGLLSGSDVALLRQGLEAVAEELASGAFVPTAAHEDIHMAVETRLTEIVGDAGGRLHTARSRNDQVATDVRLWLRTRLQALEASLVDLVAALLDRVDADGQIVIPGFTHLQRGQPVLLGHHLLAYAWMVHRDAGRVADALARNDACPLGAGAMAGTPHAIDRHRTAELLGFSKPVDNAMDAVAARDHLCEAASGCAIAMTHLPRMAEELVLWSTAEVGLVRIGEAWTTGSSIMPQKRNPDAAELIRGKAGRVIGALQTLLVMVKGLPLAYNRDLQEDRHALFDAVLTTTACTRVMAAMWRDMTVSHHYEQTLQGDFLLATELADFLVTRDVPFRDAHHAAGRLVALCESRGGGFELLTIDDLVEVHSSFDASALAWLDPRAAAERRTSFGGTSPVEIARQVSALRDWVATATA
jgi:argininosuccinate lyase